MIRELYYHNADDPQEPDEKDIKSNEETEEPSHSGHTSFVWVAVNKIIGQHVDRS